MEQVINIFLELMKSEICKIPLKSEVVQKIDSTIMKQLYDIASKQDQTHVVALALKRYKLLGNDEISMLFSRSLRVALLRHEALKYTQNKIYEVFEEEKIAYVPLKGAVIRELYPEAWMRTSCDIDILVRKEEIKRAKNILVSKLNYRVIKKNYHDITMVAPDNRMVELHFRLLENEDKMDRMLAKVWDYVKPVEEGKYRYEMTNEYLVFHSYAHMLYHFINGGCGMRYVLDAWILEQKLSLNHEILYKFFEVCEMSAFVYYVKRLGKVWLKNESHDRETMKMQMYIIEAGLFGDTESKVKARKTKIKGKVRYLFRRIFIPYKEFCASYPKLESFPILYPYYMVVRWFKVFDYKKIEQAIEEIKLNQKMSYDSIRELRELFQELEL